MSYPSVILHEHRETSATWRHPWIFSGAIATVDPEAKHGDLVTVKDHLGRVVGTGTHSARSTIAVRLFTWDETVVDRDWFVASLGDCQLRRELMGFGPEAETNGYRLCFGEADGIPGLVVDRYGDTLVVQSSTAGMDKLLPLAIDALRELFSPKAIVERSDIPSRGEEGLVDVSGVRYGDVTAPVRWRENGVEFLSNVLEGQKTGAFLDQRDLRQHVRRFAAGRRGLNLFSYSGMASVMALKGGAATMHNIDASAPALAAARANAELHDYDESNFSTEEADVFQWLGSHNEPSYDLVLLDPPAVIKSQKDAEDGKKAYHFLNRAAMRLVQDGGILVTSSCSHHLSEHDLAFILRRASVQAGVRLDALATVRQSADHPHSIYFPESAYLKSFVFRVRRS
jgi:23S rRNA (cytosine1962-C5)-methyltransferase